MAKLVLGLVGLIAGAFAGIGAALLFVFLWYDVFGIGDHGGDRLSGFSTFMALGALLGLVGGVGGAVWMVRLGDGDAEGSGIGGGSKIVIAAAAIILLVFIFFGFGVFGVM
jgi:hypothetical protein